MGENSLVEETETHRDWSAGTFVLSDLDADFHDLSSGNLGSGLLDGAATALDAASFYEDPLGALLSMGAGWLMDHIDPLKTWLNQLTGTPEQVEAHAGTWENVAGRLTSTGSRYSSAVSGDLAGMSGDAIGNYRTWAEFHLRTIEAAAQGGEGVAAALRAGALFVETVHNVVRDLISQLVGHIGSWLAEEFFSLGTATAWVVDQVVDEVAELANKGRTWIKDLIDSCERLKGILAKIEPALAKLKGVLDDGEPKPGRHAGKPGRSRAGGGKKGAPEERRPVTQGRHEPEHSDEKTPPDSHDKDKSHLHNAGQGAKNLPGQVGRDASDDGKTEVLLTAGHAGRTIDEQQNEPEPVGG